VLAAVVLEVAPDDELVAAVVLDVATLLDEETAVVVVLGFTADDGGVTTELDGALFWNTSNSTTVSASTPTTTLTAIMISRRSRIGAPCASRRSGRRRLLIDRLLHHRLRILPMMIDAS
jgi:hypothetical protein